MEQVQRESATTTAALRRAMQYSQADLRVFAKRSGVNQRTSANGVSDLADLLATDTVSHRPNMLRNLTSYGAICRN